MEPDWMRIARGELGTHETAGKKATPRIVEYFKAAGSPVVSDEIAWCSAFVNPTCAVWAGIGESICRGGRIESRGWLSERSDLGV